MTSSSSPSGSGGNSMTDTGNIWSKEIKQLEDNIRKSTEDERAYRAIELRNGMKMLIISDPTTDKAAACLNVRIGFVTDPDYLPGLAHFCEHMLFLGTKKFPEENYFEKFVHEHGGSSNAETDMEHTCYYYDVHPTHFVESLGIFASFFHEPLFTETALEREVEAVQAEDEASAKTDACRLAQVESATLDQNHPFAKFGAGNRQTLTEFQASQSNEEHLESCVCNTMDEQGQSMTKKRKVDGSQCNCAEQKKPNGGSKCKSGEKKKLKSSWSRRIRSELRKFFESNYSSNLMTLCVLSSQPIDELTAAAIHCFQNVRNQQSVVRTWPSPFDSCLGILVQAVPLTNMRQLELTFPLPDMSSRYPVKPAYYVSYLLANESPKGLLAVLKRRGLVNAMDANLAESLAGFWLFKIVFELTDAALPKECDNNETVFEIVHATLQYVNVIRERGVQRSVYDELSRLAEIEFRFEEKLDPLDATLNASADLHEYSLQDVLAGGVLLDEYDEALIQQLLSQLHSRNMRLTLIAKRFETLLSNDDWLTEKWYGARYRVSQLAESQLQRWQHDWEGEQFDLPPANVFIPQASDFQLLHSRRCETGNTSTMQQAIERAKCDWPTPMLLADDERVRCWFARDEHFRLPKTAAYFQLLAPRVASNSPLRALAVDMLVALLCDDQKIASLSYAASVAGSTLELKAFGSGLGLFVCGYKSALNNLLDSILRELLDYKVNCERFEALREACKRDLLDEEAAPTESQADSAVSYVLCARTWSAQDRLRVMEQLTVDTVTQTHNELLAQLFVESFVFGNANERDALQLLRTVRDRLQFKPAIVSQLQLNRQVSLRAELSNKVANRAYYKFERENLVQAVSTVHVVLQIGLESLASAVRVALLQHLISEAYFDQLRTREQLGYSLDCATRLESGCVSLSLFVATRFDLQFVEKRIERFLASQIQRLRTMEESEYERHKETFVRELLVRPKQLVTQADDLWDEVACWQYDFFRCFSEAQEACELTRQQLLAFCDEFVAFDAPRRAKLVIYVHGKGQLETLAGKQAAATTSTGRITVTRDRRNVCAKGRKNASDDVGDDESATDEDGTENESESDTDFPASASDQEPSETTKKLNGSVLNPDEAQQEIDLGQPILIDDVHRFKASLPLYALPRPALKLPSHGSGTLHLDDAIRAYAPVE